MRERALLEDRIAKLFEEKLSLAVPSPDADLFEAGALDSAAFVEPLLALEREFAVRISLEDVELENFRSIARIAAFVLDYRGSTEGRQALEGSVIRDGNG